MVQGKVRPPTSREKVKEVAQSLEPNVFLLLQSPACPLSHNPSGLRIISGQLWWTGKWRLLEKKNDEAIDQERNLRDDTQIQRQNLLLHLKCWGFPFFTSILGDLQLSCMTVVFSLKQASYTSLSSRQPSPTQLEEAILVTNLIARNRSPLVCGVKMERKTKQSKASSLLPWW